jgi:GntR family transcriptional regulator, transcriptional repressor for pyruvate dehydrogenase complex
MEPVIRESLIHVVSSRILNHIRTNSLQIGDRLPPEKELARILHVSRASIREGIRSLVATGVVEQQHGVGTFIARPTMLTLLAHGPLPSFFGAGQKFEDFFQARRVLEPEMVVIAALKATPADFAAMTEALKAMEEAVNQADSGAKPLQDFHEALLVATHNQVLIEVMRPIIQLLNQLQPQIVTALGEPSPREFWTYRVELHQKLFLAVRSGDPAAARREAVEHIDQAVEELRELLAQKEFASAQVSEPAS